MHKKILMVFIEPTPYIIELLQYGFAHALEKLEVIFLTENLTQNWNLKYSINYHVIASKKDYIQLIFEIFVKRKYKLLHLAGWSHPFLIFLIVIARIFFLPSTLESDTQQKKDSSILKKIIKRMVYPLLFKFPRFFLPGGTRQAKYLSHYGVKNKKIMIAQMTVNTIKIRNFTKAISACDRENLRLQHNAKNSDVVFLFVGRLLDWKGIRELIAAIKSIQDARAKLWIVGGGELADEVQLAVKADNKITYFGRMADDLLWRIYHAADVFVLASHAEPWGLVINEAMAVGLPIITTNGVGCVEDLITHHQEGLIVSPKNEIMLRESINFMLENPEKRKSMAENSQCRIEKWTLENEARNMMTAWNSVLLEKI